MMKAIVSHLSTLSPTQVRWTFMPASCVAAGWNGMAIGALAKASAVLQSEDPPAPRSFPVEGCQPSMYLDASIKVHNTSITS